MSKIKLFLPQRYIPILMYHQIERASKDEDPLGLCVSPRVFERQLKILSERRYNSISLDELIAGSNGDLKKFPKKSFILTFDDGYLDNYTNAFPILLKYGFKGTIFLVSDYVGKTKIWGTRKGAALMTWEQAREMSKYGISFQSHTCTHPDLTELDDESVLWELINSKRRIEYNLGLPVRHLAYPSGKYDKRIIELTRKAGYQSGVGIDLALRNRFSIERFTCNNILSWKFRIRTSSWSSWLRHVRHPRGICNLKRKINGT